MNERTRVATLIEIEGVRPRLLNRSLAQDIHALRAFRHVFRKYLRH